MTADPWWARLRAGQAEFAAAVAQLEPTIVARFAPQVPANPGYIGPQVTTWDEVAPGPHGDVPVRLYLPDDADAVAREPRPLFVWCHGGGWIEGDLDMPEADATAREVCARSGAVVVSVDYRLATEGVFYPVPVDDVMAAWTWAVDSASRWRASPHRAVLGGASAGGNLAAGAALRLRDENRRVPDRLVLVYPALHASLPALNDEQRHELGLDLPAEEVLRNALVRMVENYQGAPAAEATSYVAPALGDLRELPPTLIITCEHDLLRVSGEAFASQLDEAGVPHKLVMAPGVGHAHINYPWLPAAQATFDDMAAFIANA